ncbi:MAG TPA: MBL fold metallo-hydrolase [Candidatus Baltobacteraceae bacterium]|nr:MBL fold metallo-hydrolase [Candidatus Baltobacteraceae bacterium]
MTIQFLGVSCFKISTKIGNDEVAIVTDPYAEKVGKLPRNLAADVVTLSRRTHEHHNNLEAVAEGAFVIQHPGEYEVKGVPIYGVPGMHEKPEPKDFHRNTIFQFTIDEMRVTHLGGLDKALTDEQLAQLGEIDVLMIPVGGGDVLTASAAADLVGRMEPRIVIPMHYKMKDLAFSAGGVEPFIKEVGAKTIETDKWKVSKKDLPQDETFIVLLSKS